MGIPYYFYSIINKYGDKILIKHKRKTDIVYMDFNSIIHQCANIHQHLAHKDIISEIVKEVDRLLTHVITPTQCAYIAIDGQCPLAKMMQQRKRRYLSAWRRTMVNEDNGSKWDSNIVTPGTIFMNDLDKQLLAYTQTHKHKFQIILSPSSEKGEGEQKIFAHMYNNVGKECVVYGLDADLIMLSMMHPNSKHITLWRDDKSCVDVTALASAIKTEYALDIKTYIVLCFLMGNDFIPPLSYLSIKRNGIDLIISKFKTLEMTNLVTDSGVNNVVLQLLFKALAKSEAINMEEVAQQYHKCKIQKPNLLTDINIDNFPQWNKSTIQEYYTDLFHGDNITAYCDNYIEGIHWVYLYYTNMGDAPLTWFYPYSYSPLIHSLAIHSFKSHLIKTSSSFPLDTPSLQLLLVLPPSCAHMIPCKKIQKLMTDPTGGLYHLFPNTYHIETFLKRKLWECHPVLPLINLSEIEYHVRRVI